MSETYSNHGPVCPYCDRQYTADEPFYYEEDYTEEDCGSCGKTFSVDVQRETTWTCSPKESEA